MQREPPNRPAHIIMVSTIRGTLTEKMMRVEEKIIRRATLSARLQSVVNDCFKS